MKESDLQRACGVKFFSSRKQRACCAWANLAKNKWGDTCRHNSEPPFAEAELRPADSDCVITNADKSNAASHGGSMDQPDHWNGNLIQTRIHCGKLLCIFQILLMIQFKASLHPVKITSCAENGTF